MDTFVFTNACGSSCFAGGCLGWRGRPNDEASAPKHTTNSQSFFSCVIVDIVMEPVRDMLRCAVCVADRAENRGGRWRCDARCELKSKTADLNKSGRCQNTGKTRVFRAGRKSEKHCLAKIRGNTGGNFIFGTVWTSGQRRWLLVSVRKGVPEQFVCPCHCILCRSMT